MRNVWRIFRDDLRLMRSNLVAVVVAVVLCLVPALFAWFNIAGSWDPYAKTGQLKVAVANSDEGYDSSFSPMPINIGERVVGMLRENQDYGWVFVDEEEALDGVRAGRYYAAIVMPKDFSAKMMSVLSSDNEQAEVEYYLNMKENPNAPVLAGEDGAEVVEGIRVKFTEAVDEMAMGLATDLVALSTSDSAKEFGARFVARLDSVASSLEDAASQMRAYSGLVEASSELVRAASDALKGSGTAADASDSALAKASEALAAAVSAARTAASNVQSQAPSGSDGVSGVGANAAEKLSSNVSSLATSAETVGHETDNVAKSLKETVESLAGSTNSTAGSLADMRDSLNAAANKMSASASKIRKFQNDVAKAIARGNMNEFAGIVGGNRATLVQWLSEPVVVKRQVVYPVENLGSSLAPCYTVFALWVGVVLLVALMRTTLTEHRLRRYEEDGARQVKTYEQYLGRYLVFLLLALVQATIVGLGDLFFLHVQCVHPLLFLAACWLCALVFSSIAYTLAISFGGVGKALCIFLLVVQVVGMGAYPAQTMGDFFQVAHLLSPFTYGIRALQEAVAGIYGYEYALDLLKLAAFLVPSLILGLAIRRPVMRFTSFFNKKLEDTALM